MSKLDFAVTNLTNWIGKSESDDKKIPLVLETVREKDSINKDDVFYLVSLGIPMVMEGHIDIRKMRDGNTHGYNYFDLCNHLIAVSDKWGTFPSRS